MAETALPAAFADPGVPALPRPPVRPVRFDGDEGRLDPGRCDLDFLVAFDDRLLPCAYAEPIARYAADHSFEGDPTDKMLRLW